MFLSKKKSKDDHPDDYKEVMAIIFQSEPKFQVKLHLFPVKFLGRCTQAQTLNS